MKSSILSRSPSQSYPPNRDRPNTNAEPDSPCILCASTSRDYAFTVNGLRVVKCPCCGVVSLDTRTDRVIPISSREPPISDAGYVGALDTVTEADAVHRYLSLLSKRADARGRLLLVTKPDHPAASMIENAGWEHVTRSGLSELESGADLHGDYTHAIILYQIEESRFPLRALETIWNSLAEDGELLATVRAVDSWPARWLRSHWTEWRSENLYYFSNITIQSLLLKAGFGKFQVQPDRRLYTLRHICARATGAPRTLLTKTIGLLEKIIPESLKGARLRFSTSGVVVSARKVAKRPKPVCSIIVPVYNEKLSFETLMNGLLEKEIDGMEKEIIVVESNSNDGTRESVLKYEGRPDVKIRLQPKAKGKGFAVREGLRHATGDIVLIQDADLEYDLDDYDSLLRPILNYSTMFVLGARHGGDWKMREFEGEKGISTLLNLGHVFFTTLINLLYGQHMRDPFTMFKVFRRECIHRLRFECNRFDFDHELVIKLVCKGYTPLEIPVNYRSRSFKEGKKVRYRDAIAWIWYDFKFRFTSIYEKPGDTPSGS